MQIGFNDSMMEHILKQVGFDELMFNVSVFFCLILLCLFVHQAAPGDLLKNPKKASDSTDKVFFLL